MNKAIIAVTAMLIMCCVGFAALPGTLHGAVTDLEGAAIGGAQVIIRADASGQMGAPDQALVQLSTDKSGQFSPRLQPGFYDLCVMANAFTPQCQKTLVRPGANVAVVIRLKSDDLVRNAIGDKFQ
ncbi:MAG: carboxypeptidase regulatory-like domain-containing protein [Silvibacterium sp.]|nr:carboxypeptidase regulatory-like domain-containing protein [Silvibacterium sp.]